MTHSGIALGLAPTLASHKLSVVVSAVMFLLSIRQADHVNPLRCCPQGKFADNGGS